MAVKKKNKKKLKKKVAPRKNFLERDLEATLKQINGKDSVLDEIFMKQAERIRKEIKEKNKT